MTRNLPVGMIDERAYPLIKRLATLRTPPSLQWTLILALGLFIASLGFWVWLAPRADALLNTQPYLAAIPFYVSLFVVINLIAMPPLMGSFAARLAGADARSEPFILLGLTQLTGRAVIQGYFIAALLRRRLLLAISFGSLGFLIGGYMHVTANPFAPVGMFTLNFLYPARWAGIIALTLGAWGVVLLSMVVGIEMALHLRSDDIAPIFTTVLFGILMLIYAIAGWATLSRLFNPYQMSGTRPLLMILVTALMLGVPYVLTGLALAIQRPSLERRMWQTSRPEQW